MVMPHGALFRGGAEGRFARTFHAWAEVEKYAPVVPVAEIERNDWNLNITATWTRRRKKNGSTWRPRCASSASWSGNAPPPKRP